MPAPPLIVDQATPRPPLWHEPAPHHFDARIPWWVKLLIVAAATLFAIFFLDARIAQWTLAVHPLPDLTDKAARQGDIARELMMLEQWGQWVCSVIAIAVVALIDPAGRRRALAIAIGCLCTVLLTYLLKDLVGRSRPHFLNTGDWQWGGPAHGFTGGSQWGSFPSAHTTGAFALAVGLSWFYPRARALFVSLAAITAVQRVLHSAHFLSDVLAAMGLAVLVTRLTLHAKLAGRLIAILPPPWRDWFLHTPPTSPASPPPAPPT